MRRNPVVVRSAVALSALAALVILGTPRPVGALQIVPSVGISQAPDGGDNQVMLGLALRQGLLPRTQMEIQVAHRSETVDFAGGTFDLHTVPVTLSVWASPVPMLYAGGGVGAYFQAIEYQDNLYPTSNETEFGAHVGGGVRFPVAPMASIDLQGRYVFMGEQATQLSSGTFDPSFWSLSAGVAIGF